MDWQTLDHLLDAALDRPAPDREDFVRQHTADDPEARDRLLAMLRAMDRTSPLDVGVGGAAPKLLSVVDARLSGDEPLDAAVLGPYQLDGLIGEGGMAEVYAARRIDGTFERAVAIKVLRRGFADDSARRRFARERQILASLTHPNIARLYDGGQTDGGRPYFVMERLHGAPITDYCQRHGLPLEQRLRLFLGVLEGVEHAHRRGVLHRDLKPSNLMVEERGDDPPRAVVLDFGIARWRSDPALTLTGQAIGTPAYMAPEQARGRHATEREDESGADHDVRSDVFSLGAVLFELIVERPIYDGDTSAQVLAQAIEAEVRWPTDRPPLDRDLETLLMVSLAPDPRDRYADVVHLASDLASFLAGRPISMRRPGPLEQGRRLARRHPRSAAALGLALILVAGLALLNLRQRSQARSAALAARVMGQEMETVDSMLRLGRLLPRHDIRPDRRRVEAYLERFEERLDEQPGAAGYALGRGLLALGRLDLARDRLEGAWRHGFQGPEVALTLGRAYADLYERDAAAARKIRDADERQARLDELDATLRRPAIERLRQGQGVAGEAGAGSPTFIAALLAFHDEDFAAAEKAARRAADELAWLYEARGLEARAQLALGRRAAEAGEHDRAAALYAKALGTLDRAIDVGRSDVGLYFRRCTALNHTVDLARETGSISESLWTRVARLCGEGLDVDPDHFDLAWSIARVHWQRGVFLRQTGDDAQAAWDDLIAWTDRALAIRPETYQATNLQGLAWMYRGSRASGRGDFAEASQAFDNATAAFERTLEIEPAHRHAGNNLGLVGYNLALLEERQGRDPRPVARRAIDHLRAAIERDPDYAFAPNNAAVIWRVIAKADRRYGDDPSAAQSAGLEAARAALRINPRYSNALENQANLLLDAAQDLAVSDSEDALRQVASALALLDQAIAINPSAASFWRARADANRLGAQAARGLGQDPEPWWRRAEDDLRQALERNPQNRIAMRIAADLYLDLADARPSRRAHYLRQADDHLAAFEAAGAASVELDARRQRRADLSG